MTSYKVYVETDDAALLADIFNSLAAAGDDQEDDLDTLIVPTGEPAAGQAAAGQADARNFVSQATDQASAQAAQSAGSERPIARAFREFVIVHVARVTGAPKAQVRDAVARVEVDSGHPLLDWLKNGGFQTLIQLILSLLPLFVGGPKLANVA